MIAKEFEQSAVTPELGGFFGDLQLIIKANLPSEQNKRLKSMMKFDFDKATHQKIPYMDTEEFIKESDEFVLGLVLGWENFFQKDGSPVPFNTDTRLKYIAEYMHIDTGIERPKADDSEAVQYYKLKDFIVHFASELENYLQD